MSDLIPNSSAEVTTLTSNSVTTVNAILNTPTDVTLPATLANCMLNLQFLLDGEYVTDAITGSMTVQGKYKNGRTQALSTIDLSSVDEYLVIGKFTKLIVTVTSLSGADTVVVSADQNANITAVSTGGSVITNALNLNDTTLKSIVNGIDSNSVNVQPLISPATADDIVTVSTTGKVQDSGISITTSSTSSVNTEVMTSLAVQNAINDAAINGRSYRGGYNASTNLFPSTGGSGPANSILAGDTWDITTGGVLGGVEVIPSDSITALVDTPNQVASKWLIKQIGVNSFNGRIGIVEPAADDYSFSQISGTLGITKGGTGAATANEGLNALLPSQTSNTGKILQTDGTNTSWVSAGGSGSGATSLIISSPNNTISQTSQSYNATTQALSIGLQASIPQSTFFAQTGTSQTVVALLAAQIPAITDKVGNLYIVTNTSTDYINLTKTLTGSFLGYGGFADCSSTALVIPPLGVGVFATLSVGAGNANTYQITGVSNNFNINGISVFAGGSLSSIFTDFSVIDKVQNMYQIVNTNSNAITISSSFTNYDSWANCTATTMQIPAKGSALILTSVANSSYSIILTSAGLSLPTTPSFTTVTITESSNALSIGADLSQSIFSSNATTNRTVTLPDADTITVQPSTAAAGDYVSGIDTNGALLFETLPTIPNTSTSFSPADNSGSVSIANNGSFYNQFGNLIFTNINVYYPVTTGNTDDASIILTGLGSAFSRPVTFTIFTAAPTITYIGTIAAGTNVVSILNPATGGYIQNQELSSQNLVMSPLYATA